MAAADMQLGRRGDAHVAGIEEGVEVLAQQDPVLEPVRTELGVRPDVGGIQHGQRPLTDDGASALVGIGHQQARGPLAEPRPHCERG